MWAVAGFALLPEAAKRRKHGRTPSTETREETNETKNEDRTGWLDAVLQTPRWLLGQLASLAWCHACVNFGFFQLQSWLPAYMSRDLGFTLGGSGLVAAVPWFVCAAASFFSGKYADAAIENGAPRWRVRRVAMRVATLGPCVSLFSLALLNKLGFLGGSGSATALAVALVACTLATQAVAIAGFHAYLQDVAPARAGAFLGVTNTLGVGAGIAANVATGAILQKTGAFDLVFVVTALVYLSSGLVWEKNMRGKPLFPA
jgi:ACS family sodium-dependent inorganic phosphate cotransporter